MNKACNRVGIIADDAEVIVAGNSYAAGPEPKSVHSSAASGALQSQTYSGSRKPSALLRGGSLGAVDGGALGRA